MICIRMIHYLLLNKIKIEPPGSSSSSSDSSSSSLRLLASVFPSKASPEPISARIQLMRLIWLRHAQYYDFDSVQL